MNETKTHILEYKSLGALLIEYKVITQDQLNKALDRQREKGGLLGEVIVGMGFASELKVLEALAKQLNIPYLSPDKDIFIAPELINFLPERLVRQYRALPISIEDGTLTVAMVNPFDIIAIDDLRTITNCKIKTAIISKSRFELLINRHYDNGFSDASLKEILEKASDIHIKVEREPEEQREVNVEELREQVQEAPIIRLVDYIVSNAINERASDIHVEPEESRLNIRYRIDGVLHDIIAPPKALQMAIISRIKIMSDMDIAERRLPQDGRFTVRQGLRELDLRASTLPAFFGENVVLRLLEKGSLSLDMDSLGFSEGQLQIFRSCISEPHGMVLLTGPTGSGKTTTLYSALSEIKSAQTNIVTVEDPVEYQIKGIRQVQVGRTVFTVNSSG
ncbi:MAG: hypothetical protein GTO12_11645 [Proteobacteria bacterium]|nr:hypothetical protein [Pseudomonadota bacterium]